MKCSYCNHETLHSERKLIIKALTNERSVGVCEEHLCQCPAFQSITETMDRANKEYHEGKIK